MPLASSSHTTHNLLVDTRLSYLQAPSPVYVVLLLVILAFCGLFVESKLEEIDLNIAVQEQREATLREASILSSYIEAETNSTFYLIVGLGRLIEVNGGITEEHFNEISEELIQSRPGLRNIAAAPDMVIRYVYPKEGNEAAIGLDYRAHPTQRAAAMWVKENGKPLIAGPLNLVQGGEAIVGRFPVYVLNPQTGQREFWGILSTPFETTRLYEETGLLNPNLGIQVSLRGRDAKGAHGEVFYGSEAIYNADPVRFPIELLSGSWEIAAVPKDGWLKTSPNASYIRIIMAIVTLLLLLVVWLFYLYLLRAQRSRDAEAEAMQVKERFYANMSHELRTPLNGICGLAELMEMTSEDSEIKEYSGVILRSAETLTHLLDDVLTLTQIDNLEAANSEIELESFFQGFLPPLIHQAKTKKIDFTQQISPECAVIWSNPAMLRQILWNLISNAVKFTEAGYVCLEVATLANGKVCFTVSDTGVGIRPDLLKDIFKDFVQADSSDTRHYGGAGLGLAVVERMIKRLGGTVTARSELGKGSVFTAVIPNQP